MGKQSDLLEGSRDAGPDQLIWSQIRLAGAGIVNVSVRRFHETAGDVEGGRLAGAVGADQSYDLTRGDVERDVVEGPESFEVDGNVLEFEQGCLSAGRHDDPKLPVGASAMFYDEGLGEGPANAIRSDCISLVPRHVFDAGYCLLARTTPYSIIESAMAVVISKRFRGCHWRTVRIFVLSTFCVESRSLRASRTVLSNTAITRMTTEGRRLVGILNPWGP